MSGNGGWETLDVAKLLGIELPEEAGQAGVTTTANVGPYPVPLGRGVLRRQIPTTTGSSEDYLKDVPEVYREMLGLKKRK